MSSYLDEMLGAAFRLFWGLALICLLPGTFLTKWVPGEPLGRTLSAAGWEFWGASGLVGLAFLAIKAGVSEDRA